MPSGSQLTLLPLAIGLAAVALGTGIDVFIKALAQQHALLHIVAGRFLVGALVSIAVFAWPRHTGRRALPSGRATRFHTARAVLQLLTALLFFYGLTQLPLAMATTLGFSAALMVPFIAWPVLGERPSLASIGATAIGFSGTALAISGRSHGSGVDGNWTLGVLACLAAALVYATVLVMLRVRAKEDDAVTMSVFTNTVPALIVVPIVLFGAGRGDYLTLMTNVEGLPIAALGCLAYCVWYLMTRAYAMAEAQHLAPLEYTALLWSAAAGYWIFDEVPGWQVWAGGAVVIIACLAIAFERRFATRRAARVAASTLPD